MPQAKNHLTASTQAKNGSLHAVIQYKDENGKRKNKWKSLGLKEGASKAKINAAMREAVNDFEKELTEILTRSQNPDADMPAFEYMVKWLGSVQPSLQINTYRSYHNMIYGRIKRYFSPKPITIASLRPNQIDEFYQSIFDEGMVANTVISLRYFFEVLMLHRHHCQLVRILSVKTKRTPFGVLRWQMTLILIETSYRVVVLG